MKKSSVNAEAATARWWLHSPATEGVVVLQNAFNGGYSLGHKLLLANQYR